jgi:hypothetical protein
VVRTHPVSGRKGLFVNGGFTTEINELPEEEGAALLAFLLAHQARPEFTIRWRWQAGDVAFWDNRSTSHYAVDDYRPTVASCTGPPFWVTSRSETECVSAKQKATPWGGFCMVRRARLIRQSAS